MKIANKNKKEEIIIEAAEDVFGSVGYKNAKMEEVAKRAGITKVTLYTYFQSKENLYFALTHKALLKLITNFQETISNAEHASGLDRTLAILNCFMNFCEQNFLYSELMLDYFSLIRSSSDGANMLKMTDAAKESKYFTKLQSIQNIPYKVTAAEIEKGKKDGSITTNLDPMLCTLHGWTSVIGYVKILHASGSRKSKLFNVNLSDLKALHLKLANHLFTNFQSSI